MIRVITRVAATLAVLGSILSVAGCADVWKAKDEAEAATADFHARFNSAGFREIRRRADADFQRAVTEEQFDRLLAGYRAQLGGFQRVGRTSGVVLSRTLGGTLVTLIHESRFSNGSAQEQFVWCVAGGVATLRTYTLTNLRVLVPVATAKPATRAVRLVPIHALEEHLKHLKDYYRQQLVLNVEVLPALVPDRSAWDAAHQQWSAEGLAEQVRQSSTADDAVVIGVTGEDLYLRSSDWQLAFGWRADDRIAIVSYARMDPRFFGASGDVEVLRRRLRRMVSKHLGVMLYGLEQSTDPASPMYGAIGGLEELDGMGDDLASAGFPVRAGLTSGQPSPTVNGSVRQLRDIGKR